MSSEWYTCPYCGGRIVRVYFSKTRKEFRWTCQRCGRVYCYNTPRPCVFDRVVSDEPL